MKFSCKNFYFLACCGEITSLNFPDAYTANATEMWNVEADNNTRVEVDFAFVEVIYEFAKKRIIFNQL